MRKIVFVFTALAFSALFIVACKKAAKETLASEVPQDVLNQIAAQGFSTEGVIQTEGGYIVEGDILLTPDNLKQTPTSNELIYANEEHYRTTYLVTGLPRTLTVKLNTTQANFVSATDEAIRRYNALNLRVRFQRVTGSTSANINIVTYYQVSNTLGSAGFPTSSGNPYSQIQMNRYWYTPSIAVNALATTIAHEMGHCIGFRHTDYMNRSYSCGGSAVNEGSAGVGAVYIPGTPSGPSAGSWMLACGSTSSSFNRPFTSADQTALNYVY